MVINYFVFNNQVVYLEPNTSGVPWTIPRHTTWSWISKVSHVHPLSTKWIILTQVSMIFLQIRLVEGACEAYKLNPLTSKFSPLLYIVNLCSCSLKSLLDLVIINGSNPTRAFHIPFWVKCICFHVHMCLHPSTPILGNG